MDPTRLCLVADLEPGEIDGDLDRLLEVLETLAAWEREATEPNGDGWRPPGVLAGRAGIEAVERLRAALRSTQTRHDRYIERADGGRGVDVEPPGPRWYAADGRYQLAALTWITVDTGDVELLAAIAVELGRPGRDAFVADAIDQVQDETLDRRGRRPERHAVVMTAARISGLLDLEPTADTAVLAEARARAEAAGGDVVLTADEEAAYHRTIDRIGAIATLGDPLTRWLMGTRNRR